MSQQFLGKALGLLPLMQDEAVTDILINGPHQLFVERNGKLEAENSPFPDRSSLYDFIERLLVPIGKRVDAAHPYLDGRLLDGSRFRQRGPVRTAECDGDCHADAGRVIGIGWDLPDPGAG